MGLRVSKKKTKNFGNCRKLEFQVQPGLEKKKQDFESIKDLFSGSPINFERKTRFS
jgi:hypothetical protein